ncbi:GyrI-like domain-containing protein [Methanobrevibacter sp. DSM 116169]|uniref:GyrI-like domain-containing protein n=1 Tax=Methanobrevibacter sp. DSM 116169 TaxID=3242727 RepID=UPI0038FC2409
MIYIKVRFENRDSFNVVGYAVETNLDSAVEDIGLLCEKYEKKLLKLANKNPLYGVMRYTENHNYFYLIGIEDNEGLVEKKLDNPISLTIPSTTFAIATPPKNMDLIEAWTIYFESKLPNLGYVPDSDHGIYFESHNDDGVCELWTPIKKE